MNNRGLLRIIGRGILMGTILSAAGRGYGAVREPAVQGQFYPGTAAELQRVVDDFLGQAKVLETPGRIRAVIAPHAGYIYSGAVAAQALKQLPADSSRVIILAPSHHQGFSGGALLAVDTFRNALGDVPVDQACAGLRKNFDFFKDLPEAHAQEHSLEVMLPFLQRHLKTFTLIPVVVGQRLDAKAMAEALAPLFADDKTVLVASTDLSHYHPYQEAVDLDKDCIAQILALDTAAEIKKELCGKAPVAVLLELAKMKKWKPALVAYQNSGDTAGDKSRVVGYTAIAFQESAGSTGKKAVLPATAAAPVPVAAEPSAAPAVAAESAALLTPEQQKLLLVLARDSITARLEKKPLPPLPDQAPIFKQKLGCFVTLKIKGQLRGCIGNIFPVHPLARGIQENALNAAFEDPRFAEVQGKEMPDIDLEISVLTLPQSLKFRDAADLLQKLKPNVHGVVLSQGYLKQSTFLPQVWEQLPVKVQFLEHLCRKGGMAEDAWRDPTQIEVQTYEAFYFGEKPEAGK